MLILVPSFDGYQTCSTSTVDGSTGNVRLLPQLGAASRLRQIDAEDRRRIVEARERQIRLGAIVLGRDGRRADAGLVDARRASGPTMSKTSTTFDAFFR